MQTLYVRILDILKTIDVFIFYYYLSPSRPRIRCFMRMRRGLKIFADCFRVVKGNEINKPTRSILYLLVNHLHSINNIGRIYAAYIFNTFLFEYFIVWIRKDANMCMLSNLYRTHQRKVKNNCISSIYSIVMNYNRF